MMNVGEAHCDDACLFITPIEESLFISFIRVALCICAMRYSLPVVTLPVFEFSINFLLALIIFKAVLVALIR